MSSPELAGWLADRPAGLPVVGYRSWRLLWNGELRAVGCGGITWMPGVNTAACAHGFAHQAPDLDCDCGLYAYHHPAAPTDREDGIVGAVVAWRHCTCTGTGSALSTPESSRSPAARAQTGGG